jgi:hypothetical protein
MSDESGCAGCLLAPFRFVIGIFIGVWTLIIGLMVAQVAVVAFIVVCIFLFTVLVFVVEGLSNAGGG